MAPLIVFAILLSIVAVASILWFIPMSLIIKAMASSLQVTPIMIIGMRMRSVDPYLIVENAIQLKHLKLEELAGRENEIPALLEAHYLSGGNVKRLIAALIEAKNRDEQLSFSEAAKIDMEISNRKEL